MESLIKEIEHFDRRQFTDELEKRLFDIAHNMGFPLHVFPTAVASADSLETAK